MAEINQNAATDATPAVTAPKQIKLQRPTPPKPAIETVETQPEVPVEPQESSESSGTKPEGYAFNEANAALKEVEDVPEVIGRTTPARRTNPFVQAQEESVTLDAGKNPKYALPKTTALAELKFVESEQELAELRAIAKVRIEGIFEVFQNNPSTDNFEFLYNGMLAYQNLMSNVEIKNW